LIDPGEANSFARSFFRSPSMFHPRTLICAFALAMLAPAYGIQLRVHGVVLGLFDNSPIAEVAVKVYRNGEQLPVVRTVSNGRYALLLDNNAEYVLRFTKAGKVSKSYTIDTRGAAWENDKRIQDLEIDIVLFEPVAGLDLGWFDMPMGMARFNPMTGHVAWSADYERRIRPEAERLTAEVALRYEATAQRRRATDGSEAY
jgi:hypothetical protein